MVELVLAIAGCLALAVILFYVAFALAGVWFFTSGMRGQERRRRGKRV